MMELYKFNGVDYDLVVKGDKGKILQYVKANFPHYNVGKETPLHKLAYVVQPKHKLFNKGKEVYSF